MIEAIKTELENHQKNVTSALSDWQIRVNQLKRDLKQQNITTKVYDQQYAAAKDQLDRAKADSRKAALEACTKVLESASAKVQEVVKKPVSADMAAILTTIKAIKKPTAAELQLIVAGHEKNYLSYRAIVDALGGAMKGFESVTIDDIMGHIAALQGKVISCLNMSNPVESYSYQLMVAQTIDSYDRFLTAFADGEFAKAAALINGQEDEAEEGSEE
jgi:hypothetical protein